MAWLESHQELGAHPKTRKLAHLLGINKVQTVGHLHYLWWWAMDYCDSGDLSKFESLDIAIGAEWEGDADTFLDALIRAGFIDECDGQLLIHDWPEYTGRLIQRRRQDAERKRQYRAVQGTSTGQDTDIHTTAHVTQPNQTQPNQTEPNTTQPPTDASAPVREAYPAEFEHMWTQIPSGHGSKKKTHDQWRKLKPVERDELAAVMPRWAASDRWQRGFVKDPAVWLRDGYWRNPPVENAAPKTNGKPTSTDQVRASFSDYFADKERRETAEKQGAIS